MRKFVSFERKKWREKRRWEQRNRKRNRGIKWEREREGEGGAGTIEQKWKHRRVEAKAQPIPIEKRSKKLKHKVKLLGTRHHPHRNNIRCHTSTHPRNWNNECICVFGIQCSPRQVNACGTSDASAEKPNRSSWRVNAIMRRACTSCNAHLHEFRVRSYVTSNTHEWEMMRHPYATTCRLAHDQRRGVSLHRHMWNALRTTCVRMNFAFHIGGVQIYWFTMEFEVVAVRRCVRACSVLPYTRTHPHASYVLRTKQRRI